MVWNDLHEFGSTLSGDFQPLNAILTSISALDPAVDNEFLVGIGAGALVWESGAMARMSLGLSKMYLEAT